MATIIDVAVLVGSLRRESLNRRMAFALKKLSPEGLELNVIEIRDLPLYDQDDDASPPERSVTFKQTIRDCDAALFITPEYNRSIPGVLKNAIDIASRPYGDSAWEGKPAGVVSVSPGAIGGFGANHHLRQCLVFLNMPVLAQPEAYIGNAGDLFDEHGGISKPDTEKLLRTFMESFLQWIQAVRNVG